MVYSNVRLTLVICAVVLEIHLAICFPILAYYLNPFPPIPNLFEDDPSSPSKIVGHRDRSGRHSSSITCLESNFIYP